MNKIKNKKKETDIIKKILRIVLVISCLFLIRNSYEFARELRFRNYMQRKYDLSYLDSYFYTGDYPELLRLVRLNEIGGSTDKQNEEISAMANLYNCAIFYNLYESLDNTKAQVYAEKIEDYKAMLNYRIFLDEYEKVKIKFNLP